MAIRMGEQNYKYFNQTNDHLEDTSSDAFNDQTFGRTFLEALSFDGLPIKPPIEQPIESPIERPIEFNSRHDSCNYYDPFNYRSDTPPTDTQSTSQMRPIIKNQTNNQRQSTAPAGAYRRSNDWYHNLVENTRRFDITHKSKPSNGRHVHFKDECDEGLANETNGTSDVFQDYCDFNNNGHECEDQEIGPPDPGDSSRLFVYPKPEKNSPSIVESFFNGVIRPAAHNISHDLRYGQNQWNKSMAEICTQLNNSVFGNSIWTNSSNTENALFRLWNNTEEGKSKIEHLLAASKKLVPKGVVNYTWSGQLPRKVRTQNPVHSVKVFLGGIPYDLTDSDLHCTFAQFGHIQIQWPGKEIRSAIEGAVANKAGYVYIIFESYQNVSSLLSACTLSYREIDTGNRFYYNISSRRQKDKEVQIIPFDIGDRFFMKSTFTGQMDHNRTVFVGALHGMLSADGLAKVMDDLFGGVIFAGLDTDKHKYPLGSGRVIFDNQESYLKAVSAAFVEIKSHRFKKRIQIDPYIENEHLCNICKAKQQAPIFCRDEFLYFCPDCWTHHHSDPESEKHRPIIKNKSTKG